MAHPDRAVRPAHDPVPWDPPNIFSGTVGSFPRRPPHVPSLRRSYPGPGPSAWVRTEGGQEELCNFFLMRDENPQQAYRLAGTMSKSLGPKCDIHYCILLRRVDTHDGKLLFEEPPDEGGISPVVQIKALRHDQQANHSINNEISAMQRSSGDENQNIMKCIEALMDKDRVYIVSPWATRGNIESTLEASIRQNSFAYTNLANLEIDTLMLNNVRHRRARDWFKKAVENVMYMHRQTIAHRNIKPTNILVQQNYRTTLTGLSMSLLIPHDGGGRRHLIVADELLPDDNFQRNFLYMAPEMYLHITKRENPCNYLQYLSEREATLPASKKKRLGKWEYDAFALDVWALGIVLYRLLAGELPPYELPYPTDFGYKHLILGRGLMNDQNERWAREENSIKRRIESVRQKIDRDARHLLSGMLDPNFQTRLTLTEVLNHPWML